MKKPIIQKELVLFTTKDGQVKLRGDFDRETIWASLDDRAQIVGRDKSVISRHLKNIYSDGELDRLVTVAKNATVQSEGKRTVVRDIEFYNLDAIISVGYRVNSIAATKFRQWATKTLCDHITKGFTINPKQITHNHEAFVLAVEKVRKSLFIHHEAVV